MTKLHTFNIHFWLKKSSIKNDGTTPIYARIWVDSKPSDISTKESVHAKHWDDKADRVKTRTKNAKIVNDALDEIKSLIKNGLATKSRAIFLRPMLHF